MKWSVDCISFWCRYIDVAAHGVDEVFCNLVTLPQYKFLIDSLLPSPSTHAKRVWWSEQLFLSHGAGRISDFRLPIRSYLGFYDVINRVLNRIGNLVSQAQVLHLKESNYDIVYEVWPSPMWQKISLRTLDPLSAFEGGSGNEAIYVWMTEKISWPFNHILTLVLAVYMVCMYRVTSPRYWYEHLWAQWLDSLGLYWVLSQVFM